MNDEIVSPVFKIRDRKDEGTFLSIDLLYYGKLPDTLGLGELSNLERFTKKFIKRVKVDICWNTGSGSGNVTKIIPNDCMCEIEDVILNYNLSVSGIPLSLLTSNYTACLQEIKDWEYKQLQAFFKEHFAYNYEIAEVSSKNDPYYTFKVKRPATSEELTITLVALPGAKIPKERKCPLFKCVLKEILVYLTRYDPRKHTETVLSSSEISIDNLDNSQGLLSFLKKKVIETFDDKRLDQVFEYKDLKLLPDWIDRLSDAAHERSKETDLKEPTAQVLLVEEAKKSVKRLRDLFHQYDKSDHKLAIRMEFYDICRQLLGAFEKNER